MGSEDFQWKDTVGHWLWFALSQGRRQSAPCTPPSSSLLCSWPVTSLAAPRRLTGLSVALDPLAGLKQKQRGGCYQDQTSTLPGDCRGLRSPDQEPETPEASKLSPQCLHTGSSPPVHCLFCLPGWLHVFVRPSQPLSSFVSAATSFLPLQPPLLLSHLVRTGCLLRKSI